MVAYQELDGAGRLRGDAEPAQGSRDHAAALFRVVLVRPLAHVVEQQREHDQLGLFQLRERAREPPARGRARVGIGQVRQVADGHEGVLVDRVLVIEVADDPAVDLPELGEHAPEQPVLVHLRQPVVEAGPRLQELQERLALGPSREELLRRVAVAVPLDEREGVGRDPATLLDGGLEHRKPRARLQRRADGVDEADPVLPALDVVGDGAGRDGGGGGGRALEDVRQHPRHDARVMEVDAHQRLHRPRFRARRAEALGHRLLVLVAQDVLVALVVEVHHRPDAQQELLGLVEGLVAAARDERRGADGLDGGQRGQGPDRGQVAQAAGGLLDVRLEVVDGVAVVPVPFRHQIPQRVDGRPAPRRPGVEDAVGEPVEDRPLARHEPRVGDRHQELGVVGLHALELRDLPHLVADVEAEVPQRVQDGLGQSLLGRRDPAVEEDQEIDVRVQAEVTAAVAADRHQGGGGGRGAGAGGGPDQGFLQQAVHRGGVRVRGEPSPVRLPGVRRVTVARRAEGVGRGLSFRGRGAGGSAGHRFGSARPFETAPGHAPEARPGSRTPGGAGSLREVARSLRGRVPRRAMSITGRLGPVGVRRRPPCGSPQTAHLTRDGTGFRAGRRARRRILPAPGTASADSSWPGERRLRLRSPPNQPCQESALFRGADS